MKWCGKLSLALATVAMLFGVAAPLAANAENKKPTIVVIMGDDIGMWNTGAYHRGLMAVRAVPRQAPSPRRDGTSEVTISGELGTQG